MWTSVTRIKLEYKFKITLEYTLKTKFPGHARFDTVTEFPLNYIVNLITFLCYFIVRPWSFCIIVYYGILDAPQGYHFCMV